MSTNSLKSFEFPMSAPIKGTWLTAAQSALARVWQACVHATEHPSRVSPDVLKLFEMADHYDATQPGYAADLRAAAVRALRARHGAS